MHGLLAAIFVFVTVLGLSAGDAHACNCPDNNNININNENTVANNNNTNNNTTNNNTNTNTNNNYNNSNATASSGASAQSTSGATATATGGNATSQGGGSNSSTSVSVGGDDNPASSAAPVYLTTSNDTCMGSSGVGGQGMSFGFSIGTTWTDKNCVMLKNAREMKSQGHDKAAKIRLCMDEDNAIAFEAAGDPCPRALKTSQRAAAMMKDERMAALAPVADKMQAGDAKEPAAAATDGDKAAAAIAAFMLDSGNRVYFDFDKSTVNPKARKTLDKQAAWLDEHEKVRILVEGHTDERGTREYNLALGDRRANAVKQYLVGKGIAPDRIKTVSFGKDRPAIAESNEAAWSQNRRAVTQIIPPKKDGDKVSRLPGELESDHVAVLDTTTTTAPDTTTTFDAMVPALADVTEGPE
jgi:peptidoglycan-associated lipoprotein